MVQYHYEEKETEMIRIVVQADVADQIRHSDGQIQLVDDQGNRVGVVRRPPTEDEIEYAKSRSATRDRSSLSMN